MRIHKDDDDSHEWLVIDTETMSPIDSVLWADDDKGEYEQLKISSSGRVEWGESGGISSMVIMNKNIKLVKRAPMLRLAQYKFKEAEDDRPLDD